MRAIVLAISVALVGSTFPIANLYAEAPITNISSLAAVQPAMNNVALDETSVHNSYSTSSGFSESERITKVENQLQYLSQELNQLQTLQRNLTTLQGQVEQLGHQLQITQKQLDQLSTKMTQAQNAHVVAAPAAPVHKLHKHVASTNINTAAPVANPVSSNVKVATVAAVAPTLPTTDAENKAFQAAYSEVTNKQYPEAITAFKNFIQTYPKSAQLADAYYWLGELYLSQGQADLATQQFQQVISLAPKSPKAPDAMLKLGTIFLTNGDAEHAKQMFKRVATEYKGTSYADIAAKQLETMQ